MPGTSPPDEGQPVEARSNDPPAGDSVSDDEERLRAIDAISEEFPGWFAWPGVVALLYARRPRSSPPMVVRSPTLDGLRKAIENMERERGLR